MANDKTKQIKEEYEGLINNLQTTVKKSSRNTISIQELVGFVIEKAHSRRKGNQMSIVSILQI